MLRVWGIGWLLGIILGASSALAQETTPAPVAHLRPFTPAAVSLENEQKLHTAFDHLYNLEFRPARKLFEDVAQAEPESATVAAFLASAVLYEILAHQGTLQSQLFVTTNEFLRHARVPVDPELEQRFHEVNEEAERRARRRLAVDRADVDALFSLGLIYGSRANYLAGVKAKYFPGLRRGEKAYDYHKRLRKLRPEVHDAAVILGTRDFILGSLPGTHRFILFFMGARGNRERGLRYLAEAASQSVYLRTYAQILLVVAHIRSEQFEQALPLIEDLHARYPRNPIFLAELAKLYRRLERYPEATETSHKLLAQLTARPHNPRVLGPEDALLELGLVEAAQNQLALALETLDLATLVPEANRRVVAHAVLERGKVFDRQGEREKALAEYDKVLNLAVDIKFSRPALDYRRRPYRPEEQE